MITLEELNKEGFQIKGHSHYSNIVPMANIFLNMGNTNQIRLYRETELENGKDPKQWYLFIKE